MTAILSRPVDTELDLTDTTVLVHCGHCGNLTPLGFMHASRPGDGGALHCLDCPRRIAQIVCRSVFDPDHVWDLD